MAVDLVAPATAPAPRRALSATRLLLATGLGTLAVAALFEPARLWLNLLLAGMYVLGIGLGALAFVAIHYAAGAGWATVLRRVPEALFSLLPAGAALALAAILGGAGTLYPWFHGGGEHALTGFKAVWLQPAFFLARAAAYVAVWLAFAYALRRHSLAQDRDRDPRHTVANIRLAIACLFAFAATVSLSSFDWLMAKEPHWYSTIFGVYQFAGLFLSGLAVIVLVVVRRAASGPLAGRVNEAHLHDLGKLLFAFSTFWMYIWFSQFMLIWYANIPEEAAHFVPRVAGSWRVLFAANVLLNWVVPFAVLLPQRAKRSPKVLARVAVVLLAGRWLDLYLAIAPPLSGASPAVGPIEAGAALGGIGLVAAIVTRALDRMPPVPTGDPFLAESLEHHG